jgi:hypothetical protein
MEDLGLNLGKSKKSFLLQTIRKSSGSHPASYPMGTGRKAMGDGCVKLTTHLG